MPERMCFRAERGGNARKQAETGTPDFFGMSMPQVRVLSPAPSKGYKKDVAPETPDFIGGFAVSTAEKTASDFVDVKKILFPF